MAKNILLLFLSDVKTSKVGDKVLIQGTNYENVSGEECKTTNESAVRYLLEKDTAQLVKHPLRIDYMAGTTSNDMFNVVLYHMAWKFI